MFSRSHRSAPPRRGHVTGYDVGAGSSSQRRPHQAPGNTLRPRDRKFDVAREPTALLLAAAASGRASRPS